MRWRVRHPLIWTAWLIGVPTLALISFAVPETLAMLDPDGLTLSQFVYTMFARNPLLLFWAAFVFGALVGGLSVHFFWHWAPREKLALCGACQKTILLD